MGAQALRDFFLGRPGPRACTRDDITIDRRVLVDVTTPSGVGDVVALSWSCGNCGQGPAGGLYTYRRDAIDVARRHVAGRAVCRPRVHLADPRDTDDPEARPCPWTWTCSSHPSRGSSVRWAELGDAQNSAWEHAREDAGAAA